MIYTSQWGFIAEMENKVVGTISIFLPNTQAYEFSKNIQGLS